MPLATANVLQLPLVLVTSVTDWPLTIITPQVQAISNVPLYFTFTQEESGHHDSLIELSRPQHGGHRVTQNRSSSPFILFSCYPRHWCLILPNFKMAANFSVEEVVEIVAREEAMDVHVQEEASEEVTLTERITECLKEFGDASIDVDFFVDAGVSMLVPLYDLSRRGVAALNVEASQILNTQIQVGTIMRSESRLWLEAINGHLAGRRRVRNLFQSEIVRDIPYAVFRMLLRVIKSTEGFAEPFVSFGANKKAETISFSSLRPAKQLLSMLSGLMEQEVVQYFKRTLTGKKAGSKVNVIASEEKKMVFVYKLTKGQLVIAFHFGEWNTYGFPQHN